MAWWVWFVVALILFAGEILTPGGFFIVFFGLGACVAGAVAVLGAPIWVQGVVFPAVSIVAMLALRKRLLARLRQSDAKTPIDELAGAIATATVEIPAGAIGAVELRGSTWNARNQAARPLGKGERCRVTRVEGLTLFVEPEGA